LILRWVDLSPLYLIDAITCTLAIWVTFRLGRFHRPWQIIWLFDRGPSLRCAHPDASLLGGHRVVLMSFVVDLIAMIFACPAR